MPLDEAVGVITDTELMGGYRRDGIAAEYAIPVDGWSSPRTTAPKEDSARPCSKSSSGKTRLHFGWRTWQFASCQAWERLLNCSWLR